MSCASRTEQILLYYYGELPPSESEELRRHLEACAACRAELERLRLFAQAVEAARMTPPPELLAACRRALSKALGRERASSGWRERLAGWFVSPLPWPAWGKAAGVLALLALGFLAGRLSSGPGSGLSFRPEPASLRVRYIEHAPSGALRLQVEESRTRWVQGTLTDEAVRRLLLEAARDPIDPAVRADALETLREVVERPEVRAVFLEALERDPNPAIRLKALEGLKPYADDPDNRQVLSKALLSDADANVRAMAIELLAASPRADVVETLQALLGRESDAYIRQRSARILQAMNASPGIF
jgi:anti-sigma factor RsiW